MPKTPPTLTINVDTSLATEMIDLLAEKRDEIGQDAFDKWMGDTEVEDLFDFESDYENGVLHCSIVPSEYCKKLMDIDAGV